MKIVASNKAALIEAAPIPPLAQKSEPITRISTATITQTALKDESPEELILKVVSRAENPDQSWAVELGTYGSRHEAEKVLLRTALADFAALDGAKRQVEQTTVEGRIKYRAHFTGLDQADSTRACERLMARNISCQPVAPDNGA